uniref:Ribosomal protein S10 n=1 Tax=Psammoneis japonica TaxID=517775 RepID=A0A2U9GIS6_9STRA|nr:ribosomal protein S10 [Psammoneis japonica]AWQ64267.1 ribosomal protein S10 [Psammoneis japonica]
MFITIKILSKNNKSLKNFRIFFFSFCKKNNIDLKLFLKSFTQRQKKINFTLLKSPHVNKIAQEQFEFRLCSKQINIKSFQLLKFLILLKKVQTVLFSDIKIKIKFFYNEKRTKKTKLKIFNLDNYMAQIFYNKNLKKFQKKKKISSYLKLFDIYGEISIKNFV